MQNNQMINLAIMGIGTIGRRHLMAIDTIDNVKLSGIVDLAEDARSFCNYNNCLLYTSPSPRDAQLSRMPSSA